MVIAKLTNFNYKIRCLVVTEWNFTWYLQTIWATSTKHESVNDNLKLLWQAEHNIKKLFFKLKTFYIKPIFTWSVEGSSSSPSLTILGTTFLSQSISLYYACLLLAQPRCLLWFLNFEPPKKTSKVESYGIDDKISCKWIAIHSLWLFLFQINTILKK